MATSSSSSTNPPANFSASDLKAFDLAAAGHDGVLSDPTGSLIIKPCTAAEVSFYEISAASYPEFAKHMPTFMGTLELGHTVPGGPTAASEVAPGGVGTSSAAAKPHNRNTSIVLSNLTYGFSRPCVLDCKLGAQLWDDAAPPDKRARLDAVSDKTTSRPLGFRIAGMKVYKGEGDGSAGGSGGREGYRVYDKMYGRTFSAENVIEGIKEYLSAPSISSSSSAEERKAVISKFLSTVKQIRKVLEGQESRMYSASLLFVYEGDKDALSSALKIDEEKAQKAAMRGAAEEDEDDQEDDEDDDDEKVQKAWELKLIDFAHATWTPGQGPDRNALHGVESVEKLLERVLNE